jgi:hypothetical protein
VFCLVPGPSLAPFFIIVINDLLVRVGDLLIDVPWFLVYRTPEFFWFPTRRRRRWEAALAGRCSPMA